MKVNCEKPCGCKAKLDTDPIDVYEHVFHIENCRRHSWGGHEWAFALAFIALGALAASTAWMGFVR